MNVKEESEKVGLKVTMFPISGRVTGRSLHIKINTPTTGAPTFDKSHTIENSFGFFTEVDLGLNHSLTI